MERAEQGSQRTAEPRKTSTERVRVWRRNNRDTYNTYMRNYYYKDPEKARERRKRRYNENIDEERRRAREGMRNFRKRQEQQRAIDIFPQTPQEQDY